MADLTFTRPNKAPASWLNAINDHVYNDTPGSGSYVHGSSVVSFARSETGASTRSVQTKLRDRASFQDFGAVGDGLTDDTTAVTNALAAGVPLTGHGKTFAVTGQIMLPDGFDIEDAKFKQLAYTTNEATLKRTTPNTKFCRLARVTVDRNGDPTVGYISFTAGIWLEDMNNFCLDQVEVTGNGKGLGIMLQECYDFTVINPHIHDMRWENVTDPGTEQIFGIFLYLSDNWVIAYPRIETLNGTIAGNTRDYQTDGITVAGCDNWSIFGGWIRHCGEGLDVTGSDGNRYFSIVNLHVEDCDSFGMKFANTASYGMVTNCLAKDCGLTGFLCSGAAEDNLPLEHSITFVNCKAINPGSNGNWNPATWPIAGFGIWISTFDTDFPQNIRFIECEAYDIQVTATMKYGFFSNVAVSSGGVLNRCVRCRSVNHTSAAISGPLDNVVDVEIGIGTAVSIPNATETTITSGFTTISDTYNMHNGSGVYTIRETGLYEIYGTIEWAANATGFRLLTVYVNSSPLARHTALGNATVGPNNVVHFTKRLSRGDTIEFKAFQNSGGSLDINNTVGSQFCIKKIGD